jgi:hypothetical protein
MALRWRATGSHPKVSPLDDSPSPRAGHVDRTRSHGRARANVPWDVGTHMGKRRLGRRAHAFTRCLCGPRGPLDGRASGQRAYAAACRSSPPPRAARARNSSCSRPSRCMAATGPAAVRRRRSPASSRARLRALLQLLLRGFLQPPLRPHERHDGFLGHHHFSTKFIAVRQEHVDETSIYASHSRRGRVERSRARGLGGGGAGTSLSPKRCSAACASSRTTWCKFFKAPTGESAASTVWHRTLTKAQQKWW